MSIDVFKFINSNALRDHLKIIKYEFNGLEAAWLVNNCRRATLDEKICAWQEIAETYADLPFYTRPFHRKNNLLPPMMRETLIRFIENKKRERDFVIGDESFKGEREQKFQAAYTYAFTEYNAHFGELKHNERNILFPDFRSAIEYARNEVIDCEDIISITILKRAIGDDKWVEAVYDLKGNVLSTDGNVVFFDEFKGLDCIFDDLWFGFPLPFKKGDILYDPKKPLCSRLWTGPFVLLTTATDISKEKGRPMHDSSDMVAWGYFIDEDGNIYSECMHDYTSLEYYPDEKCTKNLRILKALSYHIKGLSGNIEDPTDFAIEYHRILMENAASKIK